MTRTINERTRTTSRAPVPADAFAAPEQTSLRLDFQKVLVPVDFSPASKAALEYALALAGVFDSRVHLLHVIEQTTPPDFELFPQTLTRKEQLATAKRKLVAFARTHSHPHIPVYPEVRMGRPWEEISAAAEDDHIGLIIIPTRGETGLKRVLMGSVAEKVVRHAPCPVLVLRGRKVDLLALKNHSNRKERAA